ncbi:vancomycin high temperature exclusion protein [uncultured Senegalimassilia sp.]|uniref:SanA/YdcF family protein n=1 Tax=uncultured Senegalimassilia sp. TaxID=1714350 RepID=UPI00258417DE|nr:ElyC/SanA/YdcF family protein [uncultured Senegalimassilia sp.]
MIVAVALAIVAVFAVTNVVTIVGSKGSIVNADEASISSADAIVVLGASVFADGTPSGILQDRLDDGIALYFAGVAPKLIMSGDNGTESYNEVRVMKQYAIAQGVPSEDIFCDHAGFSTYESMYRAKYVFGCQRIVVATQTYHLYRALWSAKSLGMQATGVPSDYHEYQKQLQYDIREVPARTKDFFKALFRMPSTYVGDAISLDQDGDVTN